MVYYYKKKSIELARCEDTNFSDHGIQERKDIEEWVLRNPDILGESLLPIINEYAGFDKTDQRLDILCIDKQGCLVIIELKRDNSGKNVDLQAIKYAAYCSNMDLDKVCELRHIFLRKRNQEKSLEDVKMEINGFIESKDFKEIGFKPRIIVVSKDFTPEVTTTVYWLNTQIGMDISCVCLTPYTLPDGNLVTVSNKILPVPGAEQFMMNFAEKTKSRNIKTSPYTDFLSELFNDFKKIVIDTHPDLEMWKQGKGFLGIGYNEIHLEWLFRKELGNVLSICLHFESKKKGDNEKFKIKAMEMIGDLESELDISHEYRKTGDGYGIEFDLEYENLVDDDEFKNKAVYVMKKLFDTYYEGLVLKKDLVLGTPNNI